MESATLSQQLINNLNALNLNGKSFENSFSDFQFMEDLNKTFPLESVRWEPVTPSSAVTYCTELKKRRKQKVRVTPYTQKSSVKARKSLNFS